tara:strand:+ start:568 stop:852 length:285 start_codon:yes stop_codon:yes gene_type:complete
MGRIKTTLVKRTTRQLVEKTPESFGEEFEENKKALGNVLPSKRMRNMVAGYITRVNRNAKKIRDKENLNVENTGNAESADNADNKDDRRKNTKN